MVARTELAVPELDAVDRRLLAALQQNARATYAELAATVGLRPPATFERVRRLEERGVVRGYGARVDAHELGLGLMAFVSCFTNAAAENEPFAAAVSALPEVMEVHSVAGDESYIVKVVTSSTAHLDEFLSRLKTVAGVLRTKTTVVLTSPFEREGFAL